MRPPCLVYPSTRSSTRDTEHVYVRETIPQGVVGTCALKPSIPLEACVGTLWVSGFALWTTASHVSYLQVSWVSAKKNKKNGMFRSGNTKYHIFCTWYLIYTCPLVVYTWYIHAWYFSLVASFFAHCFRVLSPAAPSLVPFSAFL